MKAISLLSIAMGLLMLVACESPAGLQSPPRPSSVPVQIALYRFPSEHSKLDSIGFLDEGEIQSLVRSKCLFRTKVDMSKGIPVSRFVPQTLEEHKQMVEDMRTNGETHCWSPVCLNFLVPTVYHNKGFIGWYLVSRDSAGKMKSVLSTFATCGAGGMLIHATAPGDQLIGAWNPRGM